MWWFDFAAHRSARLTSNRENNEAAPVWSPDGDKILYASARGSNTQFSIKAASGAGDEQLLHTFDHRPVSPTDWSRDGRFVAFVDRVPRTLGDLWLLNMEGERKPTKFLGTQFDEGSAKFSPDGRHMAYVSDESGNSEVYVVTFPDPSRGRWPISSGGGYQPRWRRDGRELVYLAGDSATLMSVDVTLSPSFKAGAPRALFQAPTFFPGTRPAGLLSHRWDLTSDGQRFLINTGTGEASGPIAVVLNWQDAMKK